MANKLTDEEVAYIRKAYKPHDKHYGAHALARRFGVHPQTIPAIAKRVYRADLGTMEDYIDQKIKMLQNDFYIKLTEEEIDHFESLKSEAAVDQYAHDILRR